MSLSQLIFHELRLIVRYIAINSPRVGSLSEGGQGEIIVNENDDAHGVMELSSLNVKVSEPNNGTFLEILRTAGKFGSVRNSY